jgi:hypothetical protein
MTGSNWAMLRQLVIGTADALGDAETARARLNLNPGFADPELAKIGLEDSAMPIGPQKFLEFVGPSDDSSYIRRWLDRGGPGGYCLSVQVPDAPACRRRALDRGVRLAAEAVLMGHPLFQMHPADVGILLELDGIGDSEVWFWDALTPGPAADAVVDDIVAVTVGVPNPVGMAELWAHIIGIDLLGPTSLDLAGCRVEFVEHEVGRLLGADFRLTAGADVPELTELFGLQVGFLTTSSLPG